MNTPKSADATLVTVSPQKTTKILCILDGFGLRTKDANNCIANAKMPNFRYLLTNYPWTTLSADGVNVGQEAGLVGNSEVGHMNLGGLKLVPQLSFQITQSSNQAFKLDKQNTPDQLIDPTNFLQSKWSNPNGNPSNKVIHLVGLFSTGTIHSDLRHWVGAIESAGNAGASKIILHIISDGRDSDRQSLVATWDTFVKIYAARLKPFEDKIFLGSLGGRFYAMDRDNNWERVLKGLLPMLNYMITVGLEVPIQSTVDFQELMQTKYNFEFEKSFSARKAVFDTQKNIIENNFELIKYYLDKITSTISYPQQIFDETVSPVTLNYDEEFGERDCGIDDNDTVWLLNFRTDRMKQFAQMLCDINQNFNLNLTVLGMNDYGIDSKYIYTPIFKNQPVQNTLSEAIAKMGKTQLHIAETEKYNHVTYFLNGGQNQKSICEDWIVIPSNKVNSHAEKPEMKAREITDYILDNGIEKYDYIIVNYANPDMVAHTGDIKASIQSLEALDVQLGRLITEVESGKAQLIITADHGNMEFVGEYQSRHLSPFGSDKVSNLLVDTEHNPNPVPLIFATFDSKISKVFDFEFAKKVDLSDSETWLDDEDIPKPKLPLWIAGKILLDM